MMSTEIFEKLSKHFQEIEAVPLFGRAPSFDWEAFGALLAKELGLNEIHLRVHHEEKKGKGQIKDRSDVAVAIDVLPIEEPIYWVMSKTDRDKLTAHLLSEKPKKKAFASSVMQEGYYRFLILLCLNAASQVEPFEQMSLQLQELPPTVGGEDALCSDIEITIGSCTSWGRLIIPESFRDAWIQHFSAFPPQYVSTHFAKTTQVSLSLCIGNVAIDQKEWKKLNINDLIIPDQWMKERKAILYVGGQALFHCTVNQDSVEIKDPALTEEISPHEDELLIRFEKIRFKMSLDKLMTLKTGSTLEISEEENETVHLMRDEKQVGLAEVIHLGNVTALKLLKL
jgi:hypothetical protein